MQILTKNKPGLFPVTGIVKLEPSDNPTYCGHFTVDALDQFLTDLKAHHQLHEMISLNAVFREDSYALVAFPDEGEQGEGILVQGCEQGIGGKGCVAEK
jgi:hypothetical protein